MKILESSIESSFVYYCQKLGALVLKFVSPGTSGVPDRIVIYKGRVWFIELKRPGGKPRPLQEWMQKLMVKHGAVIRNIDTVEKVKDFIKELQDTIN